MINLRWSTWDFLRLPIGSTGLSRCQCVALFANSDLPRNKEKEGEEKLEKLEILDKIFTPANLLIKFSPVVLSSHPLLSTAGTM